MENDAFITLLNAGAKVFDKETAYKMLDNVSPQKKKNITDLMQLCPSTWKILKQLNVEQQDALQMLMCAGFIQLEYTSLLKDEYYNINWEVITQCSGELGLAKANEELSTRFMLKCKEKIDDAYKSIKRIPKPHLEVQTMRWMTTDEGARFINMLSKPQNQETLFFLWVVLFPQERAALDNSFAKVRTNDINDAKNKSCKIPLTGNDEIRKIIKGPFDEIMKKFEYHSSIIEDHNKRRHEKWATVPECVRAVFDLIKVEQRDGKNIIKPHNKSTGMRRKIQELLQQESKRTYCKGNKNYYNSADIAEALYSFYNEFEVNQYIKEFKIFAKTADQLGLNITDKQKSGDF